MTMPLSTSRIPYKYMDLRTINNLLLCSVCEYPMVDPVTDEKNRRGCRACLERDGGTLKPIVEWIVLEMLNSLLVQCTQCDETNIKRGNLKQHEETACQLATVHCKAADIKCPWQGARGQLSKHVEICVYEPLRPAFKELVTETEQLRERVRRLEVGLAQLRANEQ